ncbi:MAG: nitrate reductase molybdenum cofactor assembly chaperone [Thermaerobacter sp.]|nr:nitrate reductase molybdenum cofactor assembly chaperone [Thermaerobacter sp.]
MNERTALKIGALLLGYPDPARLRAVAEALPNLPDLSGREPLRQFLAAAQALPPTEAEARYVETFDFREELSLYLTFQELGDGRDRAQELLSLKEELRRGGFECPEEELPDYLPLMLEFLAERPPECEDRGLSLRVARALRGIAGRMDPQALYLPLLQAILVALPAVAEGDEPEAPRGDEEDRTLPYPVRYL